MSGSGGEAGPGPNLAFDLAVGVAGALASAALVRLLPAEAWGSLRGTVAMIPVVVGALAILARRCRRAGGRRLAPGLVAVEAAVLGLLVAAGGAHRGLGLPTAEPVLAAGLFGLLGFHAVAQTVALRPVLTRSARPDRLPLRRSVLFFALPLTVYCALLPWAATSRQPDGDEPYYLLLTHSLAYDLDVDLANNYAAADWRRFMDRRIEPQPGDPRGPDGEIYSRHDALLPALLALPYRLGGRTGVLIALSACAAALAWAGLRLARRAFPERPGGALCAYGVLAFAPPLLLYAHQVWVEVPAALAVAVAYERVLAARGDRASGARHWLPLAVAVALLPALKIRFALIAGPLALLALAPVLARRGRAGGRSLVWTAGAAALLVVTLGAILWINQARYGNALKVHSWRELDLSAFSATSYAEGLLGLFWDVAFGLFFFAPLWLALVPAAGLLLARHRRRAGELALIALPYLLLTAPRTEWYGGWSPPFRYGVVLLPLLAASLAPLLAARHRPGARAALTALGLATAVLALVWVALPGWTYDLADGRTRLLDAAGVSLGADVGRFFPSFVRPRLASWIWPPLSAALVLALWWGPGGRALRRRLPALAAPVAAGAALLLAGLALLPPAARGKPTRVVELEDPWVEHRGGHLHPETWVVARSHYRAGWVIRPFEEVRVPVVPGGDRLEIELEIRFGRNNPDPLTLEVLAGDEPLATWTPEEAGTWERLVLGPFDWPAGAAPDGPPPLTLRAAGPPRAGRQNGFLLDRMELRWR